MGNLTDLGDRSLGIDRLVGVPVVRNPPGRVVGGKDEIGILGQQFVASEAVLGLDTSAESQAIVEDSEGHGRIGSAVLVSDEDSLLVAVVGNSLVLSPERVPGFSNLSVLLAHNLTVGADKGDVSELKADGGVT